MKTFTVWLKGGIEWSGIGLLISLALYTLLTIINQLTMKTFLIWLSVGLLIMIALEGYHYFKK